MRIEHEADAASVNGKVCDGKKVVITVKGNSKDGFEVTDLIPDPSSEDATKRTYHVDDFKKIDLKI